MSETSASVEATSETAPVRTGEELDWPRLEAYLREHVEGLEGEFSVLQFPRGSANLTYQVTIGRTRLVVRRPPLGQVAPGAHDMAREYRVLSKLHAQYDRAPRALALCEDVDVIGAPFLVSEYRSGVVVWNEIPETMGTRPDAGRAIGFAVAEALADLHDVDPEAVGLGDLGRPEGYLERQVSGWMKRWSAVAEDGKEVVTEVGARLNELLPDRVSGTIIHNDFKIDNCQFAADDPDRVASVFDWDMATLGDPLADVGTLLNYWPEHGADTAIAVPGLDQLGLPTKTEIVERYAQRRGLNLGRVDLLWYEALGCWKTAIIMQQLYMRWVRGESTDPRMAERGGPVVSLAERALNLLDGVQPYERNQS
ncbi:MAG: phosphotransferase family protein [Rhodococcus sp. (in: high G+C Gram-positive bacteria)]|uniref:phosphotransferase family protein n=1 Tax=Rhodococcus sp. TaxID=1831 RepID=UPI001206B59F|nr:phosphotransferase family protein [Rhodococcus sp. (in: high G+C Gram-positive bacteria)]RZL23111.1 MAG: phosphotransferase family protein [Rhodococcus sp. (in: high G+C Gram-positive bacteria)]